MKKRFRLRRRQDFTRVIRARRAYAGRALLGFAVAREDHRIRIGVTSSRDVRGAVARNRVRRRLREVARSVLLGEDSPLRSGGIGYDVVLIARPLALELALADLQEEARGLLARLVRER